MTATPRDGSPAQATPEVANLGFVRPPLVYLASIVGGWALHVAWPLRFSLGPLAAPLGILLVVAAIALFAYAARTFRAAGTPVPARKPTTAIVRTGPYRFSRNPIYLALSLLQLGIAVWAGSWWLVATLAGAVATIHLFVIPREERYLEGRFGAGYLDYKRSVRRWL